jgi:hypothetical protein
MKINTTSLPCPPWQRLMSYMRRHVPVLLALAVLAGYVFGPTLLQRLVFFAHEAPPLVAGGPDLEGTQVLAAQQAAGWMQLGAITSKLFAGVAYFSTAIFLVWFLMHYITPALPTWAKRSFTTDFNDPSLPLTWKFALYTAIWLGLLFLFAVCVLAASLAQ